MYYIQKFFGQMRVRWAIGIGLFIAILKWLTGEYISMLIEKVFGYFGITSGGFKDFAVNHPLLFFLLPFFFILAYSAFTAITEPKWFSIEFIKNNSMKRIGGANRIGISITNNTPFDLNKCKANLIYTKMTKDLRKEKYHVEQETHPLDAVLKWNGEENEYIDIARGDTKVLKLAQINVTRIVAVATSTKLKKDKDIQNNDKKEKKPVEYKGRFSTIKPFFYDIFQGYHEAKVQFFGSINGKPLKPKIVEIEFEQRDGKLFIFGLGDIK